MPKTLPNVVTHLDILKTIAIIFVIVDHIGFYFFPDQLGWRAFGRLGAAPFWFFLIGYALSRELPNNLLIGALVLVLADLMMFSSLVPFNILVSIVLLRLTIDYVVNFVLRTRYIFIISVLVLSLTYIGVNIILEYGTFAWLFGMLGYLARHKETVINNTFFTKMDYVGCCAFTVLIYCFYQNAIFKFSDIQFAVMTILTASIIAFLANMRPMTFPQIQDPSLKRFLQFCGRNTLEIYVAHLLLFKVLFFAILTLK